MIVSEEKLGNLVNEFPPVPIINGQEKYSKYFPVYPKGSYDHIQSELVDDSSNSKNLTFSDWALLISKKFNLETHELLPLTQKTWTQGQLEIYYLARGGLNPLEDYIYKIKEKESRGEYLPHNEERIAFQYSTWESYKHPSILYMKETIDGFGNKLLTDITLNFLLGRSSNECNSSYMKRISNEIGIFMHTMIQDFLTNDECMSPHMMKRLTKKIEYKTQFLLSVNRMIHWFCHYKEIPSMQLPVWDNKNQRYEGEIPNMIQQWMNYHINKTNQTDLSYVSNNLFFLSSGLTKKELECLYRLHKLLSLQTILDEFNQRISETWGKLKSNSPFTVQTFIEKFHEDDKTSRANMHRLRQEKIAKKLETYEFIQNKIHSQKCFKNIKIIVHNIIIKSKIRSRKKKSNINLNTFWIKW